VRQPFVWLQPFFDLSGGLSSLGLCWHYLGCLAPLGQDEHDGLSEPCHPPLPEYEQRMKAYQITGTDGLASLQQVTLPDPLPQPGEVLVRIRACCLNYRDLMNVLGIRGVTGPVPRVPCSDGAGEIRPPHTPSPLHV